MHTKTIGFGVLFGFVLSRVGATDYDAIRGMFRLTDLQLMGVIGTAIALCAVVFAFVRRHALVSLRGERIALAKKPMVKGLVVGSVLFGVGWAMSGTCPGTALAQIGEGRLAAIVTFAGILLGAYLPSRAKAKSPAPVAAGEKSVAPI
jgi:uncharacterized membrane protein YedE/YeeE